MTGQARWVRVAVLSGVIFLAGMLLCGAVLVANAATSKHAYSTVKRVWTETRFEGHWSATYDTFDGLEGTVCLLREGQVINLSYDLNVEKGMLTVVVIQPDGSRLWTKTVEEPLAGVATLVTKMAGRHTFRVQGEATSGGFDLTWNLGSGDK